MSSAPVLSADEKRALMETPLTRFYVRLGLGLGAGLFVASILVWMGTFERMLTFGNWGWLSQEDLLGFLVVVFWMMTAALLVVLFTLKRTLTRVEVDVQARDIELDRRVHRMAEDVRLRMADAQADLRQEHNELMVLADRSNRSDQEVLARARAEVQAQVAAARDELEREMARLQDAMEAQAEARVSETMQGYVVGSSHGPGDNGLVERVAQNEAYQAKLVHLLRVETAALQDVRDTLETRVAAFERTQADNVARDLAQRKQLEMLAIDQKDATDALRERIRIEHDELVQTIDDRMHDLVRSGVNKRIHEAIEVAFRPGRFYKALAAALGVGIAVVSLLALAGAEGPGFFTAKVAIFALGLASAILAMVVFVLIYSFTDTVRTLRGFAGQSASAAETAADMEAAG